MIIDAPTLGICPKYCLSIYVHLWLLLQLYAYVNIILINKNIVR